MCLWWSTPTKYNLRPHLVESCTFHHFVYLFFAQTQLLLFLWIKRIMMTKTYNVKTLFTCNVCIYICIKLQQWVPKQQVIVFTLIEFFYNYFFPAKSWQIWLKLGRSADFLLKLSALDFYQVKKHLHSKSEDSFPPKTNKNISLPGFGRITEKVEKGANIWFCQLPQN